MLETPWPFINLEYVYYKLYSFIFGGVSLVPFYIWFVNFTNSLIPYATVVSLLALIGLVYTAIRIKQVENVLLATVHGHHAHVEEAEEPNKRWQRVVKHINSENESDWRLAIMEADLILEEMLEKMGYHGETIADKLRGVEKSDFLTINEAWEAHKVRNQIAHEGGDFRITNRDARLVIHKYEQVFREFHFI